MPSSMYRGTHAWPGEWVATRAALCGVPVSEATAAVAHALPLWSRGSKGALLSQRACWDSCAAGCCQRHVLRAQAALAALVGIACSKDYSSRCVSWAYTRPACHSGAAASLQHLHSIKVKEPISHIKTPVHGAKLMCAAGSETGCTASQCQCARRHVWADTTPMGSWVPRAPRPELGLSMGCQAGLREVVDAP